MKPSVRPYVVPHLLLATLVLIVVLAPNQRPTVRAYPALLAGLLLIELAFLASVFRRQKKGAPGRGPFDIVTFIWVVFIVWELATSVLNLAHPVLVPAPENVFDTFRQQWKTMLLNVAYSMQLLFVGLILGLVAAVVLGLAAGWLPRVRGFAYPIANVMAPIPPVVFSPYLVSLMPTFRSASGVVILLGVFWPTFLGTINRVAAIEPEILDSARMLRPSNATMIFNILLPCILPDVVSGLKVSLTTSLLMLNYAELMGATHGMGYYVQNSITYANYTGAVAGIMVIGLVVTLLSFAITRVQARAVRWR